MTETRKIIHIDMDAFYASVEQLDNPELRGRPVIVGGRPDSRGVVAACSYEARAFGIRSAMPCAQAYRRCPEAIFISPRMQRYRAFSERIMAICRRYTDLVEPVSLDEAYLDVTSNKAGQDSATILARDICRTIREETGLTASAGVSCNKFVAKIASDLDKPNGLSVIAPDRIEPFLARLPIGRFHGIGRVTEKKMIALDIKTGADLRRCSQSALAEFFGKNGTFFYNIVRGIDPRPVEPARTRKSIGAERTLARDTRDMAKITDLLTTLAGRVSQAMEKRGVRAHTVTLKVRYDDFSTVTRSTTVKPPLRTTADLVDQLPRLIGRTEAGARPVRLLGISVANLSSPTAPGPVQLDIPFPAPER